MSRPALDSSQGLAGQVSHHKPGRFPTLAHHIIDNSPFTTRLLLAANHVRLTLPSFCIFSNPSARQPKHLRTRRYHLPVVATFPVPRWLGSFAMYSAQQTGADNATINPAALSSPIIGLSHQPQRSLKRSHSPVLYDVLQPGDDGDTKPLRKRAKPMNKRSSGSISEAPGQAAASTLPQAIPPPQTPQSQGSTLPQASPAYTPAQTQMPPKTTPTKSTLKALPTVRDHTTDQLNASGDEYLPREIDEFGEKKSSRTAHSTEVENTSVEPSWFPTEETNSSCLPPSVLGF
ncbi:hypothetical protein NXS19_001460 [Fusarium pseudograminearum]|nr:hypothetical protein NXS19_001460 [Fusarium pseudograminearum]